MAPRSLYSTLADHTKCELLLCILFLAATSHTNCCDASSEHAIFGFNHPKDACAAIEVAIQAAGTSATFSLEIYCSACHNAKTSACACADTCPASPPFSCMSVEAFGTNSSVRDFCSFQNQRTSCYHVCSDHAYHNGIS